MADRTPIIVPDTIMPEVLENEDVCDCMKEPVDFTESKGYIFWNVEEGEPVEEGHSVCSCEVKKRVVEIPAPCTGILVERCVEDNDVIKAGDVIGYIE